MHAKRACCGKMTNNLIDENVSSTGLSVTPLMQPIDASQFTLYLCIRILQVAENGLFLRSSTRNLLETYEKLVGQKKSYNSQAASFSSTYNTMSMYRVESFEQTMEGRPVLVGQARPNFSSEFISCDDEDYLWSSIDSIFDDEDGDVAHPYDVAACTDLQDYGFVATTMNRSKCPLTPTPVVGAVDRNPVLPLARQANEIDFTRISAGMKEKSISDSIFCCGMRTQPLSSLLQRSPCNLRTLSGASNENANLTENLRRTSPSLHLACLWPHISAQDFDRLLKQDPQSVSRSVKIETSKPVMDPLSRTMVTKLVREPYTYPLHLAILNKASPQVIEMLIDAAPSVLLVRDGAMKETPLCVLLKLSPDVKLVDMMLLKEPKCVFLRDRHDNTALHVACSRGVSTDVLRHLRILYPKALDRINLHGKTPLKLAQERSANKFSESMCKFIAEDRGFFYN